MILSCKKPLGQITKEVGPPPLFQNSHFFPLLLLLKTSLNWQQMTKGFNRIELEFPPHWNDFCIASCFIRLLTSSFLGGRFLEILQSSCTWMKTLSLCSAFAECDFFYLMSSCLVSECIEIHVQLSMYQLTIPFMKHTT